MNSLGINYGEKLIFSTGNIMSINDIIKKPSQSSTQELIEAINFTLKENFKNGDSGEQHLKVISRVDDTRQKIQENGVDALKIGLKVFLTNDNEENLKDALNTALSQQLDVSNVSDVIVSFKKQTTDDLDAIKKIWRHLESYVEKKVVGEIGIADVEESTFRSLYNWAKVKPNIIQINLATCCVVPPTLQAFCKENDLKLFTHSDSSDILPSQSITDIFEKPLDLQWAVRYTIHIKCRGVLITKGYCLCFSLK
ncbi:glutamate--cysteine ligase regulatory subunit [Anthonomus grandis grandis]|uniref:glutamate--cysteine ligase regulatory subunit n=1 Tax=Anthonomus grandis grandis TaxID=2921223 RepID=UPI0021667861|nr:glutamate--cysteine ligase regulatory subunit [Anthonomus grandis grandis]